MILNIRGSNGSGKTHMVLQLLKQFKGEPVYEPEASSRKPDHHRLTLDTGKTVGVCGGYLNACGGCDGIHPYDLIWPRVLRLRGLYDHVLFEGMAVSSSYGNIGRISEPLGEEFVFAFLDTPVEVCVRRVESRRKARGATKPFDPHNIIKKWRDVQRSYKVVRNAGRAMVVLNYRKAYEQLLTLLRRGYDPAGFGVEFPTEIPPIPPKMTKL